MGSCCTELYRAVQGIVANGQDGLWRLAWSIDCGGVEEFSLSMGRRLWFVEYCGICGVGSYCFCIVPGWSDGLMQLWGDLAGMERILLIEGFRSVKRCPILVGNNNRH
ncbi:hypothetical protein BT63DRAFT_477393 [Microthyrium microscopicum]|uniref:Uncharacterized protein n=1 Tax=Microthyrium microscopicum TaxID=703497 RepID=A0A6A6UH76_9PEZI|nr:hypothetical protein BT63DRAFT_477393 [Microthyrium microscopicum]